MQLLINLIFLGHQNNGVRYINERIKRIYEITR